PFIAHVTSPPPFRRRKQQISSARRFSFEKPTLDRHHRRPRGALRSPRVLFRVPGCGGQGQRGSQAGLPPRSSSLAAGGAGGAGGGGGGRGRASCLAVLCRCGGCGGGGGGGCCCCGSRSRHDRSGGLLARFLPTPPQQSVHADRIVHTATAAAARLASPCRALLLLPLQQPGGRWRSGGQGELELALRALLVLDLKRGAAHVQQAPRHGAVGH
ncbi:unnamed protein product, partial [Ectocarpus sp. 4 AP-2014]